MELGRKLHELWHLRLGLAVSVTLALLAALWSVDSVSLSPLGLRSRHLVTSTATASALVDARKSAVLDLATDTGDFVSVTNRALLITNVMAGSGARRYIARRAGVPAAAISISSPVTPKWPRPLARPGQQRRTTDILKPPGGYRISLQSNPTVPEIDVYATAPSSAAAVRLADGAIQGTRDYLVALGLRERIPPASQVQLRQLGPARGGAINGGAGIKIALLSFLVVFTACAAATLFFARVHRGWHLAGLAPTSRS